MSPFGFFGVDHVMRILADLGLMASAVTYSTIPGAEIKTLKHGVHYTY